MLDLISVYLWLLAIIVLGLIVRDFARRKMDLLSVRNLYLVGFVYFQLHSPAMGLRSYGAHPFPIQNPVYAGVMFSLMATVFLFVFLYVYHKGWLVTRAARWIPTTRRDPAPSVLLVMAIVFSIIGVVARQSLQIPVIGAVMAMLGAGLIAVGSGLVGWTWGRSALNPAYVLGGGALVLLNAAMSTIGVHSRRGVVSVLGAAVLGLYFAKLRTLPVKRAVMWVLALAIPAVLILGLVTSIRSVTRESSTAGDVFNAARNVGDVKEGSSTVLTGGVTGRVSLWIVENYPANHEHRHMRTVLYFFELFVPRMWWPEKPTPLSRKIAKQARVRGVDVSNIGLPAGIIGNAGAEGGLYAVFIYAGFFALFCRFFDDVLLRGVTSPFAVVPIICGMAHIVGMPRGEASVFAVNFVITVVTVWFMLIFVGKFVDMAMGSARPPTVRVQS